MQVPFLNAEDAETQRAAEKGLKKRKSLGVDWIRPLTFATRETAAWAWMFGKSSPGKPTPVIRHQAQNR